MSFVSDRRQTQRRAADRQGGRAGETTLPAPVTAQPKPARPAPRLNGEYAAQLLGQGGEKRGLRGGAPVLEAAKSAYLETEFSGPDDRRPPTGRLGRKEL